MRGHTVAIGIIGVVVFVLCGIVGYLLFQNQELLKRNVTPSPAPTKSVQDSQETLDVGTDSPDVIATVSATPSGISKPPGESQAVVVVEGEANLPAGDKDLLYKRVINPFVDYYKNETGSGKLMSLKISTNTNPSKTTYPYKADAIFDGGVNIGFLVSKTNGQIDWWLPECMVKCNFSATFKTKYPEIVAKSP